MSSTTFWIISRSHRCRPFSFPLTCLPFFREHGCHSHCSLICIVSCQLALSHCRRRKRTPRKRTLRESPVQNKLKKDEIRTRSPALLVCCVEAHETFRGSCHGRGKLPRKKNASFHGSFRECLHGSSFHESFHGSFHGSSGSFHGSNFHGSFHESFHGSNFHESFHESLHGSNFHESFHEVCHGSFHGSFHESFHEGLGVRVWVRFRESFRESFHEGLGVRVRFRENFRESFRRGIIPR